MQRLKRDVLHSDLEEVLFRARPHHRDNQSHVCLDGASMSKLCASLAALRRIQGPSESFQLYSSLEPLARPPRTVR